MFSDNKAKTFSRDHSVDVSLNRACRNAGERRELSVRTPGLDAFSDQIAHFGAGDFCFAFAHDIGGTVASVEDDVDTFFDRVGFSGHIERISSGMGRRYQKGGEVGGISLYDDYAHHLTEIKDTL